MPSGDRFASRAVSARGSSDPPGRSVAQLPQPDPIQMMPLAEIAFASNILSDFATLW